MNLLIQNVIFFTIVFFEFVTALDGGLKTRRSIFGEGYGTEWIYFPDGEGVIRFVNLTDENLTEKVTRPSYRIENELEFRLYTKKKSTEYVLLDNFATILSNESFDENLLTTAPIKVITHGWMSTAEKSAVMDLVHAYLAAEAVVNIIAVDWGSYAMNTWYIGVAKQTREVGIKVANFLDALKKRYNIDEKQIHLLGHSLGAHVMGIAGYETKLSIGRITGLDPALPMFTRKQTSKIRLDYNDAQFVDVIHTCGGILGFWDAIGAADFYPNNGMAPQPGCNLNNIFLFDAFSHSRAHVYYAESILNPQAFPSYQCETWTKELEAKCPQVGYMGENANRNMSGIIYLKTNSEQPFGRGTSSIEKIDKIQ